nr:hypothetical protein RTCK_03234 [Rhizobium sp. TCK]
MRRIFYLFASLIFFGAFVSVFFIPWLIVSRCRAFDILPVYKSCGYWEYLQGNAEPIVFATVLAASFAAVTVVGVALSIEQISSLERNSRLAAALRADDLHAQFNSLEMRKMRSVARRYLCQVLASDKLTAQFAEAWMSERVKMPDPFAFRKHEPQDTWAVSILIAFYVRLVRYIDAHAKAGTITIDQAKQIAEPFHWPYWSRQLIKVSSACECFYSNNRDACYYRPYFADDLKRLDKWVGTNEKG